MRTARWAGFVLIALSGCLSAGRRLGYADQLILANGDQIHGRLASLSREFIAIETPHSGIIRIERKYVDRLSTDKAVIVDLVSGERIIGQIFIDEKGKTVIRSSILGERALSLNAIDAIHGETPVSLSNFKGKGAESQKVQPIGQKPDDEEDIRKIFLRQAAVLLSPGQIEIEAAINYARNQSISSVLNTKIRQFQLPIAARVGLFQNAEGFVGIPMGYVRREMAFVDGSISHKRSGIGDLTAGLNYEIAQESARRPDIIASFSYSSATGSKPNEDGLAIGSGHRAITAGMQFIKSVDPVALFWGISGSHQFEARYFFNDAVHRVKPGETAGYNFGFGFAVNENISFSAQLNGSYQFETRVDGAKAPGSSSEPVSLRSALTFRHSNKTYIEPSVSIGLDDDTPDFILGFSLTRRFGKKGFE